MILVKFLRKCVIFPLIAVAIGVLVVVKKGFRMCPLGGLAPRRGAENGSFSYEDLDANPEPSVFLSGSENRIRTGCLSSRFWSRTVRAARPTHLCRPPTHPRPPTSLVPSADISVPSADPSVPSAAKRLQPPDQGY